MSAPAQKERSPAAVTRTTRHLPVGVEADQDLLELSQHFRGQRIVLGGPVEADGGDARRLRR